VNETAELVAPAQPDWLRIADTQRFLCWWASGACRPGEQRWAMFVVGADECEFAEDRIELGAMEDQQAIGTLPADGPVEPLG
jgi:hypothetical protein